MAIRATAPDASGVAKSVRELLDDARACEGTDNAAARAMAQQARVLARTLDDLAGEAEALYRLASIAYSSGQADDAFAIALEARDLARRAGKTVVEVWALNLIGLVHYNAGNFSEALESALQALELYRLTDHRIDEGNLLNTIAIIHHSLGDTDRALVTYEAALTANKGLGRPDNDVLTLSNMAEVRAGRNEHLLAVSLGEAALDLSRVHS
ncbi:MAG: tetratricopeptide repeat protein, partial [Ilumatobacteraceae bacterium]